MLSMQKIGGRSIIAIVIACIVFAGRLPAEDGFPGSALKYAAAEQIATLENEDINESSGLVASRRTPGVFWTHNDSGDSARMFSFDQTGKHLGECQVRGAAAVDWEDIGAFKQRDQCWLVLCDVGDNARRRPDVQLYFVHEPAPTAKAVDVRMTVRFRYPGGPQDCEAVAVEPHSKSIFVVGKTIGRPEVFVLPLPRQSPAETLVARSLGRISAPLVTGLDASHDGRRLVAGTYGHAFEFVRQDDESWQQALGRVPRRLRMPARRQGEAICFGHDSYSLFLTSEHIPTPLWKLNAPSGAP